MAGNGNCSLQFAAFVSCIIDSFNVNLVRVLVPARVPEVLRNLKHCHALEKTELDLAFLGAYLSAWCACVSTLSLLVTPEAGRAVPEGAWLSFGHQSEVAGLQRDFSAQLH